MADSTPTTYSAQLADFAANTTLSRIPEDVRSKLSLLLLDAISSMLAGVPQPVFRSSVAMVEKIHSSDSASAIDGTKTSLSGAMLLNGIACGDFEFEHVIANAHPASAVLPALLTVAAHKHASGEDFTAAMAVGYELATRIGAASGHEVESVRNFHNPGLNGAVAAAAAVGCLLKLDAATISSAMGIAASSSGGLMAFVSTGAMTKRLHPARAGQLGAEAAFMAQVGIDGPSDIFDNAAGFFQAFSPHPQPALLTEDLGATWKGINMILKLSPVHMYAQHAVYAINKHRTNAAASTLWEPDEIESVTAKCGVGAAQTSHGDRHPMTLVGAQYSVVFAIAAALAVDLRDPLRIDDALLANETVHRVADRISMQQVTDDRHDLSTEISVKNADGREFVLSASDYPGLPGAAEYDAAVLDKFERVASALHINTEGSDLVRQVRDIGSTDDVNKLYVTLTVMGVLAAASR